MPVVVDVMLERVSNISMGGAEIDAINEIKDLAESADDAPTAISPIPTPSLVTPRDSRHRGIMVTMPIGRM